MSYLYYHHPLCSLNKYLFCIKEFKICWLFEGQTGDQYSVRSVQQVLKHVAAVAKIKKNITIHTLRHSFATHLMEHGTDLRYIQSLPGHKDIKTTEVYTHITTKAMNQTARWFGYMINFS